MLDLLPFNIISPAADKLQNIQPGKKVKMYKCKMPKSAIFSQFLHFVSNQTRLIFISFRRNQHPPTLLTCQHNFHGGQWHRVMDSFEWTREVRTSRDCHRMFLELLKYTFFKIKYRGILIHPTYSNIETKNSKEIYDDNKQENNL